ncbi:HPF/RaiA family ribosome-associated protein [Tautonia marina]|uniref:HPF/RaiA family ribosome-associated protein n=1 Tax=Tautonia marina TaxID=2653855 RepID=UPI001260FE5D|nr:HPF/RaiA family ribosome-associated protein [Tautonia marina]
MHVQLNTNNHVHGSADLADRIRTEVEDSLSRFGEQITRVEVHVSDVNGSTKSGIDIKCTIEARLAGLQPIAVTDQSTNVDDAVTGALKKLERSLDSTTGRLGHVKGRTSFGGDQEI